jgi:hypothetical protein
LQAIESKIGEHSEKSEELFAQIKDKASEVQATQDKHAKQRENVDEKEFQEDISAFEQQVTTQHLQQNKSLRRQQETAILKELDEKSFQLSLSLNKIKKSQDQQ